MTRLTIAQVLRVAFAAIVFASIAFTAFLAWRAVSDYQMQVREGWRYRCGTIQAMAVILGSGSLAVGAASAVAYRSALRWERRLHGTREV